MPVLMVRHAHALSRSRWEGEDDTRELSVRGHRQAQMLIPVLKEFEPGLILSSPSVRCMDTLRPLADTLGRSVRAETDLAEGSGRTAVTLVRSLAGGTAVLCSHGDVIPDVLAALADEDGLDLGSTPRVEKASIWLLEADRDRDGRFRSAAYLPPPEVA